MSDGARLTLSGVRRVFDGAVAIEELDLEAAPGELVTLLGPSGCGKTTTLRIVGGFERPDAGRVLLDDRDVTHEPPERRRAAMVFQHYALFPNLTVAGNVEYALRIRRVDRATRRRRVGELLDLVGLAGFDERRPDQLSGGQQQRVALARALAAEPRMLLLDEPLSNLDAALRREMRATLRHIQTTSGITTLWVTHDREEALAVSDRLAILRDGRLEQIGSPRQLCEAPTSAFVAEFLLEAVSFTPELAAQLLEATEARHVAVRPDRIGLVADEDGPLVVTAVLYGPTRTEVHLRTEASTPFVLTASLDTREVPDALVQGVRVRLRVASRDLLRFRSGG